MKKGIFKKLLTGALACMMCLTAIPSKPDTLAAGDRCDQGQQDGYDWELWNQWDQGTANMQLTGNGTFSCNWSGIENVLFRTGKKWTSNSPQWDTLDGIKMDYEADYQPNGNSYLSVYGWTKSPLVEYYIIESWGTWRPPGGTGYKSTITVDGVQYDVYQTTRVQQPSIEGTKTFPQYFSVRKEGDKSTKGTVDISKHFAAWESLGLDMGGLYEVSLVVEGYQSSGKATVKKNNITIGGGFDPDTPTTPIDPDSNGYYFHSTYESGTDDWSARGDNTVAVSGSTSASGSKSLYVSGRTEAWNGAGYSLNSNAFIPGKSYSFSTMVMQNASASEDMKLSLQYNDSSGETQYATIAEATASKGQWTQLKNTSFTIPSGASNMLLYVETNEGLSNFYMDEAIGAVDGKVIPASGNSSTTPDDPDVPSIPDGDYYFHSTYESSEDNWTSRGDSTIQLSGKAPYAGKNSLLVSGRTEAWHGAGYNLSSSVFKPGNSYSFSAMAMQDAETSTDFKLSLQYDDASGETQYATIAEATGTKGYWTQLANTNFEIPSGASNMLLYVETDTSLTNFYMDEAIGAAAGTVINADVKTPAGDVNEDGKIDSKDLTALRDFIMGKSTSASAEGSDLDGNGRVDSLDLAALRKLVTAPPSNDNPTMPDYPADSLVGKFGHLFKMGTSVSPNELNTGADFIKKHFNSITPENALKPEAIIDKTACQQRGNNVNTQINLSQAASTLKFCEQNGIGVRGHTFVWYSQTPDWFFRENFSDNGAYVSKEIMDQRLESMIKNTFDAIKTQYPNLNLYAYDVCNELFLNDGGGLRKTYYTQNSGESAWAKVYGEDNDEFIIKAFTYARKYAPAGCKLYINDYNEYVGNKTNDIYNIAMKLKELGIIDGIGMQSHLDVGYPNAATYKAALEKFLSTGLEVSITELDITESSQNSQAQADLFKAIFEMAVEHADQIPSFTVWGTHDSISWRGDRTPLLFGSGYTPKKAYDAVMSITVPGGSYSNSNSNNNNNNNNNNTTSTPGVTDISWIDPNKPMVALSFDDGPISTAQNSAPIRIQNALSENGFHATFFYWGERINSSNEAEITRAHNLGFEVANHTYTHPDLTGLSPDGIKQEIQKTADILTRLTGKTKFLIRPPYLAVNSTVQQNAGAPLITCAIDSQDWNGASTQQMINTIVSKMNDGSLDNSIVLMHENYDSTAAAIEYLVPYLKQNGWQVVTISEMFKVNNKTLADGSVYGSAK
ncbi:MAG: hypothetical protein E7497_00995 [Ruminococcus sp.]|nr:hypothetical protein [Ruminococcus sp.]